MKKKLISLLLVVLLLTGLVLPIVAFADGEPYTVSFDPGTGTGSMASVTVNAGEGYTLPACTFTHTNSERTFYRWSVGDELKAPGDSITINADTTVKALWHYTTFQRIDNSVDKSTTEVVGKLILRDTRTGEELTEVVFDEVTASAFTNPSNITVSAMITEAQEALSQAKQEYAGQGTVTTVSETVSDPEITKTVDSRTFTTFDGAVDDAGDYFVYMIVDGDFYHNWQYTVMLEAEYESVEEPAMSYLHILPGDGGSFTVSYEGKTSDDQPWEMPEGTLVTVTAIPDEGYTFKGWYKGDVNGSTYEEMLTDEILSPDVVYMFTATGYPYLCPVFEENTTPAHGATEIQVWIGDTAGNEPGDSYKGGQVAVSYTPSYDDYPEDVVAKDSTEFGYGQIFGCYLGDELTLIARPDAGYRFVGWYLADGAWPAHGPERYTGDRLSDQTSYTFTFTGANRLICAVFETAEPTYTVTVSDDGHGSGAASPAAGVAGTEITLTAEPNEGYRFREWQVISGGVTETDNKFTLGSENVEIKAIFELIPTYTISAAASPAEGGTVSGAGTYAEGSSVTLTATPNTGYRFVKWTKDGTELSTEASYTFTAAADAALVANFELIPTYTVTFNVDGADAIPDQTVLEGDKATRPADPIKEGYVFDGWYQDATFAAPFDFNTAITADAPVYVKWTPAGYILTAVTGATVDSSHSWTKGSTSDVVITVKLNDGVDHSFDHFTGVQFDGTTLINGTDYTAREGSTIVTLRAAMLQNRTVGAHTVTILFNDGSVNTTVTVRSQRSTTTPSTGDGSNAGMWLAAAAISALGLVALAVTGKKRRP